jgi:hypothetical protein
MQQGNSKDLEPANLPATTLAEVADATEQGIQRLCKREDLVVGLLATPAEQQGPGSSGETEPTEESSLSRRAWVPAWSRSPVAACWALHG